MDNSSAGCERLLSFAKDTAHGKKPRVLAVRSLLITEGIASTRIYVRALGNNPEATGSDPADRADILVVRPDPVQPQPQTKPTP